MSWFSVAYVIFLSFFHLLSSYFFFFNDTATTEIYTLSLHDALPIRHTTTPDWGPQLPWVAEARSEEHTSELQSRRDLVCRLLLEKKKKILFSTITLKKKTNYVVNKKKFN